MELTSIWDISLHTKRKPLGSVKTIYTERADYHEELSRWVEGPRRPEEKIMFDNQGRIVEFTTYENGLIRRKYTNTFDMNGNLAKAITFNGDDSIVGTTNYTYGPHGNRTTFISYEADGSVIEKWNYIYNARRELAEIIVCYPNGSLKTIHVTNDDGIRTRKAVEYDLDGSAKRSWIEINDCNRKVFEQSSYDADGSLRFKWVSSYDSEGNEIERDDFETDGSLYRKFACAYDGAGNITKRTQYSSQGEIEEEQVYIYDFDQVGNWTKKTMQILVLESDPPLYRPGLVIYRTFTYWADEK